MGCGANRSTSKVVQSNHKTEMHNDMSTAQTKKSGESEPASVRNRRVSAVDKITVMPSQFILRRDKNIFKEYTLQKKIGEGKEVFKA